MKIEKNKSKKSVGDLVRYIIQAYRLCMHYLWYIITHVQFGMMTSIYYSGKLTWIWILTNPGNPTYVQRN